MPNLAIHPIRTEIFRAREDLLEFLLRSIPANEIREGMLVAITSKIVSLAEDRLVPQNSISKAELVRRESDLFLGEVGYGCFLTVKEGLMIPSAGIDESNSEKGDYILYPADPFASAEAIWRGLRKAWKIENLGVILTDSHTSPLRRGVTGICLSYYGFQPLRNLVGSEDLFGRPLRMTQMNLADGLAAAAVLLMGEGSESTPLATIHGAGLEFGAVGSREALRMPLADDLYAPLLLKFQERPDSQA